MNIDGFVKDWLAAANAFEIDKWVNHFHKDAALDDPSVGCEFMGHDGIGQYFKDYFIGYNTQTRLVKLDRLNENKIHLEVEFTGDFPGKQIGGTFDLTFRNGKIAFAKAELI